jgi:hypothetical protein
MEDHGVLGENGNIALEDFQELMSRMNHHRG